MPTRPPRPCATPNCPATVQGGRCATHERARHRALDATRGTATQRGYGVAWRATREAVLRDEPLCRACAMQGIVEPATDVDHVIPRRRGGTDDLANLEPLCHPCHSRKTAAETFRGETVPAAGPACPDPLAGGLTGPTTGAALLREPDARGAA